MTFANVEAEHIVLGALLDSEAMGVNVRILLDAAGLTREDFTDAAVRAWFESIRTLAERDRHADYATVWTISKGLPGVPPDGANRLAAIQAANVCSSRSALATHAQEIRRLTRLRQVELFLRTQLTAAQTAGANPVEIAAKLEAFARNFSGADEGFGTGEQDLLQLSEEWEAAASGHRKAFLPTGIDALDDVIMGWEENLNVVGGPPSAGKSALLTAAIFNALTEGHRVCVFGLEDGTKWIAKRLVSRRIGMPIKQVGKALLTKAQQEDLSTALGDLANPLRGLFTYNRGGVGTAQLVQLCRKAIAVHKVRAIFIDHGLEIRHEGLNKGDELRTRIQHTFAQLRDLAFTTHTPVIVVVHFNRSQGASDGPPTMGQFAECAGIERMARLAIGLWERDADGLDHVRCSVIKQTEGEKGIHLLLRRETQHALIANAGGTRLDLRAQKMERSRSSAPWADARSGATPKEPGF